MKTFLQGLNNGNFDNNLSHKQKEALEILKHLNAVTLYKGKFYLNNGFITGKLDISSNGTGFITAFGSYAKDFIVENKNLNSAHLGDIVVAKILKAKKSRLCAKILAILEPAFETSVVYLKRFGEAILGVNVQNGLSIGLKASQKSLKLLPPNAVLKINNVNNEIIEVLGILDDPLVDEKISLAIYNKKDEFSLACQNEAVAFGDKVDANLYENRINLEHLPFCTIDPDDAKDFDDAIFYDTKQNTLYVAIADVSEYVSAFSATDKEAKIRGFSIYFPHKSIPMLPRALSENICSLKPNETRLAFVFKISLNDEFDIIKEELFSAVIKSKKRFTYGFIDEVLALRAKTDDEISSWLLPLYKVTKILKEKRLKKGFDFHSKELKMDLDENFLLKSAKYEHETPSHALIEDCMLLANKAAAKRIYKGIFRNHEAADIKKINFLIDDLALLGIEVSYNSDLNAMIAKAQTQASKIGKREDVDKLIIKAQKRAQYSSTSSGHFGLGFDTYTHFTSPIRRYSDLILHRLLKAKILNDDKLFNYYLNGIDALCEDLNTKERQADKVAFDFMDRKFARWAAQNLNKDFICYISEISNPLIATLDDEIKGARIFIANYTCELFTRVKVRIISSDIASAKIIGKVVEKYDV